MRRATYSATSGTTARLTLVDVRRSDRNRAPNFSVPQLGPPMASSALLNAGSCPPLRKLGMAGDWVSAAGPCGRPRLAPHTDLHTVVRSPRPTFRHKVFRKIQVGPTGGDGDRQWLSAEPRLPPILSSSWPTSSRPTAPNAAGPQHSEEVGGPWCRRRHEQRHLRAWSHGSLLIPRS